MFFFKEKNLKFVVLDFLFQIASQFENMYTIISFYTNLILPITKENPPESFL